MRPPKPTKEQQILFDLLKGEIPTHLHGLNIDQLFHLFQRHRLFPLAPPILEILPLESRRKWEQKIKSGSHKSLRLTARLLELTNLLAKAGLKIISLKGPLLAHDLYGDLGQRHMRDLDLLVIDGDIRKGIEVLQKAGYQLYIPGRDLKEQHWKYYFRHQYDVVLRGEEPGNIVELHAGIAYPGLLNHQGKLLTDDLQQIELAANSFFCMSRESTFLYLALHGAHHLFFRLFWLRDLAEAMSRWDLDYQLLLEKARALGIERMVGVSLRLAELYFGVTTPLAWQAFLNDHDSLLRSMEIRCHRIIHHPDFLSRKNRWNVFLFTLASKKGWKHKWTSITTVFHRWYIRKYLAR